MGKISIDLSSIKAAGIYTIEIDESQREITNPTSLRLLTGFNNKGPFNRPVFMQYESERQRIFGDIDNRLEQKGCFFNRMAQTMLRNGPVLALNLLKVDDSIEGPDQVNYAALSLDAGAPNPQVNPSGEQYGEYDYMNNDRFHKLLYPNYYDENKTIPYVGKTPYSSLFDRSKFWIPSKENLQAVASNGLNVEDTITFEHSNLINFANVGTDEISILVFKPEGLKGYDITAKEWWGGNQNIPYGWIRPSDYISDYFIRVVAVKGNWTNYQVLAHDPIWGKYFDENGIIKSKVGQFCAAEGITFIGSWTGTIIPDFIDKKGNYLYIQNKINANTERTGILMSINEDAFQIINYDKNGIDNETGNLTGKGTWIYDLDFNAEGDSELGEGEISNSGFLVDMVGHNLSKGIPSEKQYVKLGTELTGKDYTSIFTKDSSIDSIVYLGFDTSNYGDSLQANSSTALVRMQKYENTDPLYAYVLIDASTKNVVRPISGGKEAYIVDASSALADNTSTSATAISKDNITATLYAHKDVKLSYNTTLDTSIDKTQIPSKVENVYYKKVPIKQDTNDNFVYQDVSIPYGVYAGYNKDKKILELYQVVGTTNKEYATVNTIGQIDYTNKGTKDFDGTDSSVLDNAYRFVYNNETFYVNTDASTNKVEFYSESFNENSDVYGINFLSYNFNTDNQNDFQTYVYDTYYFNGYNLTSEDDEPVNFNTTDSSLYETNQEFPVAKTNLNMFIVTNEDEASFIQVGDYVNNLTWLNNTGDVTKYDVIPGVTRVISKVFVNVDSRHEFIYKNTTYKVKDELYQKLIKARAGKRGFYLYTTIDPVYIDKYNRIIRQYALSNDAISHSLKFIPMKGLHISSKHRPGFDENGRVNMEAGIEKIYSMLEDEGIRSGLSNPNMVEYRYIVDSMSYGLANELGGKVYLSRLAHDRGKTTALLNLPSKRQFELSQDPCFCDTYERTVYNKPPFRTKYIPMGGNSDLYSTMSFSLPTEDDGSKFTATFWPNLIYQTNGRRISVPPAADVCDVLIRKFQGGDPYVIAANRNGIIRNPDVVGVEFMADTSDREYLEPFGVNTIIQENNDVMIYGNQTAYQDVLSDYNKLHVRENLNTLEIACEAVLKQYNFLYNTAATRASIVTALTPILEAMKLSQAIEKYNIVCDESNNTPDIIMESFGVVDIEIWMSHGMEKIVNRITLKRRDMMED